LVESNIDVGDVGVESCNVVFESAVASNLIIVFGLAFLEATMSVGNFLIELSVFIIGLQEEALEIIGGCVTAF